MRGRTRESDVGSWCLLQVVEVALIAGSECAKDRRCERPSAWVENSLHCAPDQSQEALLLSDFAHQVEALRPQLLRFARTQLRNEVWAEDAVSETLLAALERPQAFAGQSQVKTWLVGVLKHKVVDQLRRNTREATILSSDDNEDMDELLFDETGHWRERPCDWGNPEAFCNQRQFFEVLEACVELLPATQGRVFMMREWLELDTEEICKTLDITATNLWVLLHRARLRLRDCIQLRWFDGQAETAKVTA
ncbi:MAG: sigma-70 family RNA polymerase sigma factor [Burkholderiales bacterium]|nr:sigma-70 family RNA polymerase sigma factor [Burkholderiales bacterium]